MCPRSKSTRKNTMPGSLRDSSLQGLVSALAEKQPTPGGGAAAAIAAAIGDAAGAMACAYTQRKKDKESGAAAKALVLRSALCDAAARELVAADEDAEAYAALQTTWTDKTLPAQAKAQIEASALAVPTGVVERCHEKAASIAAFAPSCNPNIVSDAKVGVHLLAGAARAAYQTVLVNSPPDAEKARLRQLLSELDALDASLLGSPSVREPSKLLARIDVRAKMLAAFGLGGLVGIMLMRSK